MERIPYGHRQALAFLGAISFVGALFGAVWAAVKGAGCDERATSGQHR